MKLSKVLSLVLAIAMLLSVPAFAGTYPDVAEDATYFEAVEALTSLGIITGYDEEVEVEAAEAVATEEATEEDATAEVAETVKTTVFKPEGKITRAEYATIVMRLLGSDQGSNKASTVFEDVPADHWASGNIAEAYGAGIINGKSATIFDPSAEVTYEEAIKMLVCAMGYQKKAEALVAAGTNPFPTGYNMVASQKKLTEGTAKSEGGATRATVARLAYNALAVNLMDQSSFGTDVKFEEIKSQSLLYTKLGAIKVEAKIQTVSLDPAERNVTIDVTKYDDVAKADEYFIANAAFAGVGAANIKKGSVDLAGLQGLSVTALIDVSESSEPELIAVFPKAGKNVELAIAPSLFKGITGNTIEYYKDQETTTVNTSSKLNDNVSVYVNGLSVTGTVDQFAKQHGVAKSDKMYRFIDTDNDGYYDTLFVDNSASFVVGKINASDFELYRDTSSTVFNSKTVANGGMNEYDFAPLTLDPEDEEVSFSITDEKGKALDFSDITVGDVLTVAKTEDGSFTYYSVKVAKASEVTGTITEQSENKLKDTTTYITAYTIDGTEYILNDIAYDEKLEPGITGTFKITADGRIISYVLDETMKNFAVGVQVAENNSSFSSTLQAQIVTAKGEILTLDFASKFELDDVAKTDADTDIEAALNTAVSGQPVVYELNSKNEIRKLYTVMDKVSSDYDTYDYTGFNAAEFKAGTDKLGSAYLTDNTAFVAIKDATQADDKDQYLLSSLAALEDEEDYEAVVVYDENKEAVFVVLYNMVAKPAFDSTPFVVTGISKTAVDGSTRSRITGFVENKEVSYNMADEEDLVFFNMDGTQNASVGEIVANDVIQFVLNGNDEIVSFRHLAKFDSNSMNVLVAQAGQDQDAKDDSTLANMVKYPLTTATSAEAIDSANLNGVVGTAGTMTGYADGGRAYKIANRTIELFNLGNTEQNLVDKVVSTRDLTSNPNIPAYVIGSTYSKFKVASVDGIKPYYNYTTDVLANVAGGMNKADDIVYVYSFDGDVIFTLVVDTLSNNYK